jgi:hypothetical protein
MSKYGSPSGLFVFDGYNLLAHKLQGHRVKVAALTEPYTGVGDSWEENIPVGVQQAELAQEGAFFHDDTGTIHERLAGASGSPDSNPNGTPGSGVVGFEGNTIGQSVYVFDGALAVSYEVLGSMNALQRANVEYLVTGRVSSDGVLLHALGAKTADGNTQASSVDGTAQTTAGGFAFLQVTNLNLDGGTSFDVTIQDSPDDAAWGTLQAMTARTAIGGETITVAGTVERYLAVAWDFTGTPGGSATATFVAGFARF